MMDHLKRRALFSFRTPAIDCRSRGRPTPAEKIEYVYQSGPNFLSYPELVLLSKHDEIAPTLNSKLTALLTTPFVNNEAFYRGARYRSRL